MNTNFGNCLFLLLGVFAFSVETVSADLNSLPFYSYNATTHDFTPNFISLPPTAPPPAAEKFRFYSQAQQDFVVLTIYNDKPDGYYVDLAANHFRDLSNTYILDHYNGWKGVCIEPNPMYLVGLLSNRKCTVVTSPVSNTNGEEVTFKFDGVYGGLVGEEFDNQEAHDRSIVATLVTTTLTSVLDFVKAPKVMDYLSLDVEGAEQHVLAGLDHSRYLFMVMTIERPKPRSHHILSKAGYRFVYQMTWWGECIYFHQSKPDYAALMFKYRNESIPNWLGKDHHFFLSPAWDAPFTNEEEQ